MYYLPIPPAWAKPTKTRITQIPTISYPVKGNKSLCLIKNNKLMKIKLFII